MNIKRYKLSAAVGSTILESYEVDEHELGDWVKWEDVEKLIAVYNAAKRVQAYCEFKPLDEAIETLED
jgi:hypothetical protein